MTKEQRDRINKVREARDLLSDEGYYVSNLWMVNDVLDFELDAGVTADLSEDEARWVLYQVLNSSWITEQIYFSIGEHIQILLQSKSNKK